MSAVWDDPSYAAMAEDFDRLFDSADEISRLDAVALNRIFEGMGVQSVLDCACGTGIQAIGLASLGYRVEASDISPEMVDIARRKAAMRGLSFSVRQQDFRSLVAGTWGTYDAVVCYGGSITLVQERDDIGVALASMLRVVSPGGLLVVGVHDYGFLRDSGQGFLLRRGYTSERGDVVFDARSFEPERVRVVHTILRLAESNWRVHTTTKSHHYLDGNQLVEAMEAAGCESVELRGIDGHPLSARAEWVVGVGRRRSAQERSGSVIDSAPESARGGGA